jgi:uncharacterized membrane protein YbhN (UPF0104 family)
VSDGPPRRLRRRWRALLFVADGDGAVRRRASDVVRVVLAMLGQVVLVAAVRADLTVEHHLVDAVVPPPEGLTWLVSALWQIGTVGLVAALALLAILSRRVRLMIELASAIVLSWLFCGLAGAAAGTHGGHPADVAGADLGYPLARLAVMMAAVVVVLPYLNRAVHRIAWVTVVVTVVAAVLHGAGLPVGIAASLLLGWGVGAAVHLALGTPAGLLTPAEVLDVVDDLGVRAHDASFDPVQDWGIVRYRARDEHDQPLELALAGRDAADAQALGRAWRLAMYRDAGPRLSANRLEQVEHEAYLTLLVERAGVSTADVVVAGQSPETGDAVLVTRPPSGRPLAELEPDELDDDTLDALFQVVSTLREARLAHGGLNPDTIVVEGPGRVAVKDLRLASFGAPAERSDRDLADALVAVALLVGPERAIASALRVLGPDEMTAALPRLQPAALDRRTRDALHSHKKLLDELRSQGAAAVGVDEPELATIRRVSWGSLLMGAGAILGVYLIVQQFTGVQDLGETLKSADWGWVFVCFVLAQSTNIVQALSVMGSVATPLPFGPTFALQLANAFTGLIGGTVATTATIIRYFQRRGLAVSIAVSSGVMVSLATMITQTILFVVSFLLTHDEFSFAFNQSGSGTSSSGGGGDDTWVLVLIAVGIAIVGAVTIVPRFRRQAVAKLRPQVDAARANLRGLAGEPMKLVELFGGAAAAQLLFAMTLGAALHAYGASASLGELLVINTIASLLGGLAPVPGGMGVIEGGLIAGFTAIGIPNTTAVAATLTARLMTAYLPPIWGYPALVWMRHEQYL